MAVAMIALAACDTEEKEGKKGEADFKYLSERFADLNILRYRVPGFDTMPLNRKKLIYYLSQAALAGRDIIYDQNYKHNLLIRRTLETIVDKYSGDQNSEDFQKFMVYVKRVWFSNGIHHHYSSDKFLPEISPEYFAELIKNSQDGSFPLKEGQTVEQLITEITPVIFDPTIAPKRVSLDADKDLITSSAINFYDGVSQQEVEDFYKQQRMMARKNNRDTLISFGLNSKVVKENGKVVEQIYSINGLYKQAIEKIVYWLELAMTVAENDLQKEGLAKLIDYYKTGDLKTWDDYNILWVKDLGSRIDYVNGFIEVYGDPMGNKATWEAVVNYKDMVATQRAEMIGANAQWFEDNSPVDARFKRKEVKGVSAKVITVAQLGGDCHPTTPIGINLPNANWIRAEYGSKSVTMENIMYAYDQASQGNGFIEEFAASQEEIDLQKKYGFLAGNLHTDLHECVGHASGQLLPGITGDEMKNYHSALEESRADLFALYYMMDPKMVELGLMPSLDVAKAEYNHYFRNGYMTQLTRVELGKNIEQAHMRNRQLIARWCYENGKNDDVIEVFRKEGKTYIKINDYDKLRALVGKLLAEVQRIKSEGDFAAGKALVESYAVKVDPVLHKEIKERYAKLNICPYSGFINPVLTPVMKGDEIQDIEISYPDDFTLQMLDYAKKYSFLPTGN